MSVTGVSPTSRELIFSEIERVAVSNVLKGSESLCRLLRYLGERSIARAGEPVKEHQIATEVFGRSVDFDPRLDATVRVQTGRLRSKLAEYYAGEGAADPLVVEIPKGSYTLVWHVRAAAPAAAPAPVERGASRWVWPALCAALTVALAFAIWTRPGVRTETARAAPSAPLRVFWRGFAEAADPPLVVFSNAEFVGRPETGMRYFNPARDRGQPILDHYTGVGEALAIHDLDGLFAQFGRTVRVKRGRLFTFDDAASNNLIFIGSPSENTTLRDISVTQDFAFRVAASGERKGDLSIVNLKPRPGEPAAWFASSPGPLKEDYAVVGVAHGAAPGRWMMLLAGTTTIGTQAAVEQVCREPRVRELLARAGGALAFEAVIRVRVAEGVPVASGVAALHAH